MEKIVNKTKVVKTSGKKKVVKAKKLVVESSESSESSVEVKLAPSTEKKTKSKVIISYDDHPDVRKECKGLNIKKIDFCYGMTAGPLGKCKPVKELLIKNF